jgi:hypothetical protein
MIRHPNSPHGRVSNENGRQDLPISSTPVVDLPGAVVPAHGQRCQSRDHGHAAAPHLHHTFRHFRPFNSTTCARNPSKDRPPHVNLESDRPNYAVLPGARARASISKSRSSICTLTCFTIPYRLRRREPANRKAVIPSVPAFLVNSSRQCCGLGRPTHPRGFPGSVHNFAQRQNPRLPRIILATTTKYSRLTRNWLRSAKPRNPSALCIRASARCLPLPSTNRPEGGNRSPGTRSPALQCRNSAQKCTSEKPRQTGIGFVPQIPSQAQRFPCPVTLFGHVTRSRQVIAAFRQRTRRLAQVGGGIRRAQLVRIAAQHLERKIKW